MDGTLDWAWMGSETGSAAGSESQAEGHKMTQLNTLNDEPKDLKISQAGTILLVSKKQKGKSKEFQLIDSDLQSLLLCCRTPEGR